MESQHEVPVNAEIESIIQGLDERIEKELEEYRAKVTAGNVVGIQYMGLGNLATLLPLYCHPSSRFYRSEELIPLMDVASAAFLASQHPSGCVSLANCNIDSPPDTSFTSHLAAYVFQLAVRYGSPEIEEITGRIRLFLERAKPCLLTGGIHTPNHRWVMASALAKMEEIFGGDEFRKRAFQFLDEGLDITEYGEWTERSNAIYNAICAYHLYNVGVTFGHEPSLDAARSTLRMTQYMLHPGDTIVTEYSGRQDYNAVMKMDDRYYVAFHLLANRFQDPELAALARVAQRTAPKGALPLIHYMVEPENMTLPEAGGDEAPDSYTVLFGENRSTPVPDDVWYHGPLLKHPHGAPVLRHRRGKLSVTAMAGQPEMLYLQYGAARLLGLKISAGWFGIGGVAFPSIHKLSEDTYRMEILLKGSYFQPLPEEHYRAAKGSYIDMPNHLRERTNVVTVPIELQITLYDDGADLRLRSEDRAGIFLQATASFDLNGTITADALEELEPNLHRLTAGAALFRNGADWIRIEGGAVEHQEVMMRNDSHMRKAQHLTMNFTTPTDRTIRLRCGDDGAGSERRD
ncbi:hypothetical protein [Paenibacillus sp.]|uniref:hypothetical protein n=1 Tax=Paenibacillus sp. TaxID=58172 RepID=UPI002D2CD512|nr:hypothetical protein [Paenibacillus sp.]HZG58128.1 hypothetical protein [Paenibacillus sp.]